MEDWRPKNATFQKFLHLENVIFNFFGGPGGSPSEKILPKMVPKGYSHLNFRLKLKSLTPPLTQIGLSTLKMEN